MYKKNSVGVPLRGGVNRIEWISNWFLLNFLNYFSPFESIQSWIFESNRTNFEPIQHLKNLTPPYNWSRIKSIEFLINFHRIFHILFALSNQSDRKFSNRIERISNEFQFDSTISSAFNWIKSKPQV